MKTVLTIAGFDPSSGAGVTADLMVFAAHGLFGTAAVSALTVQSTLGVRASYPVETAVLRETLECLKEDLTPAGVKIGMVGATDNIREISRYLSEVNDMDLGQRGVPVVLDPVLISSSGRNLLDLHGIEVLREAAFAAGGIWVTPNVDELGVLGEMPVKSQDDLVAAARALQRRTGVGRRGRRIGVLAKGGHLERPDDLVLTPEGEEHWLAGERIETGATHGTGCALSSALLSGLVLGYEPVEAARRAKEYVAEAMRRAPGVGQGKGPMGLLWPLHGGQRR